MKTIHELFTKYLNDQCSPAEVKELLAHFDIPEDEKILKELIHESLDKVDDDDDEHEWKPATDHAFAEIKKRMHEKKVKVVPLARRAWFRVAVAAVFLVGVFAIYNWINNRGNKQEIVSTGPSKSEKPGSNKAVLILANGSTIVLETAENGTVAQQGNVKIEKQADGQLAYKSLNEKPTEVLFNRIATPRGGHYQVVLSDGSKVWLNAASSLRFPAAFTGSERKVELIGEAYFEVAKNASMPFKVQIANKGEVEVLGTHFNVNAYNDEPTVNTTLLKGKVKVIGFANRNSKVLTPGEQANLEGNGQISINKNVDTEQALAWKNGVFSFNNSDLKMVFRELSRWYDVDIKFERPLQERQFKGEMQRDLELWQVLKLLEKNNVLCRLEGKTLVVLN